PGDPFKAWDVSATYDYMPRQYITFRWELNHRHANVPYWTGPGGITPPGGNNGNPGALVVQNGSTWEPDLRHTEDRATMAILVKF
ncbi:MAG: porin, partial [Candidatus Sulfotelmatobacter sp.]